MKFRWIGDISQLERGITQLSKELQLEEMPDGTSLEVRQRAGGIKIVYENGKGLIEYEDRIHFFRALGLFLEAACCQDLFQIEESPQFTTNGVMFDVSRNAVLTVNSVKQRFDIMNEHLQRVRVIASHYGLQPMIWSDMYFRLGSPTGDYYDMQTDIAPEIIRNVPQDVMLVYWDYYHHEEQFYCDYIKRHRQFGSDPIFAGGIWTWGSFVPNYGKTFVTTDAALSACKKEGIREVFATLWGDNGAETSLFAGLLGLQLYAEHGYAERVSEQRLRCRFEFCTGGRFDSFYGLRELDETPGVAANNHHDSEPYYFSNPSKFILWQDVLLGLYDHNISGMPLNEHYAKLMERLERDTQKNGEWSMLFAFYERLCHVLSLKSEFGIKLKERYDLNDKDGLADLYNKLPELKEKVEELRQAHRTQWFDTYKPFEWEVMDIRYGGLLARLDTAMQRIADYLDGRIESIRIVRGAIILWGSVGDAGEDVKEWLLSTYCDSKLALKVTR